MILINPKDSALVKMTIKSQKLAKKEVQVLKTITTLLATNKVADKRLKSI